MATKYIPSAVQHKCECFICHKGYTAGLEHHHMIAGRQRKACDEHGLWIWLCRDCHTKLHDKGEHDKEIRALAQRTFIENMKKKGYPESACKEEWFRIFGKFYE